MWMYEKRPGKANHSRFAGVIWRRRALILSTFLDARLRGHDEKVGAWREGVGMARRRSEEHTSELQSRGHLVCRLLLEKKKKRTRTREQPEPRTQLRRGASVLLSVQALLR